MLIFATIADGIAILITAGILLYGPEYNYEQYFNLPPKSYDDYMRWVDNAEMLLVLRMEMGVFVIF